jgi:exonuclease VII large subunit
MKKCGKCKEVKELIEFNKCKSHKDGLQPKCKACVKQYFKEYYQENAEERRQYNKQYYQDTIEERKQYKEQYQKSLKDGLHHVYYLPNHNYVGITDNLPYRMANHRSDHNRITDNYQILASFEDRDKALRLESIMHDSGFEGRHAKNIYK